MENQVLIAVPLFVMMGVILERSRVAEDLLHIAGRLLGQLRGGLGFSVVIVGALLAASTGIVGATVITMTLIALPTMLREGYDPRLASGTIAASGTLGQIIPPSIVLILLADAISNANQTASMQSGIGAQRGFGRRPVCRCADTGPPAGGDLSRLYRRDGAPAPGCLPACLGDRQRRR